MARPIQPTPVLRGKDAKRLLSDLANVCSPAEAERRIELAKQQRAEMIVPKSGPHVAKLRTG